MYTYIILYYMYTYLYYVILLHILWFFILLLYDTEKTWLNQNKFFFIFEFSRKYSFHDNI